MDGRGDSANLPGGVALDLFMVEPESWGLQLVIRTGSWQFSKYIVGDCCTRAGYAAREGQLWRQSQRIPTPEEGDVFRLLKVSWVEPWAREV